MHYVLQQMHLLRMLLLSTASCCFCCFFSLQVVFKIEVNSKSLFALWQHVFSRPTVYFKLPTFVLDRVRSPANLKKINLESVVSWAAFSGLSLVHRQDAVTSGQTLLNQNTALRGSGGCSQHLNV